MKEILTNLYLGCDADVEEFRDLHPDGAIIHAAKERWHRDAVGYTGRGAPKDHPEYLVAIRGNEMMLNLVDAPKPEYIPQDCFFAAHLFFSDHYLGDGTPMLIHCNQGKSRGPGVLLYCIYLRDYILSDADSSIPVGVEEWVEWLEETKGYDCEFGEGVYLALQWMD